MKQLRFLVARIDRIGDVVLSTALPREIKQKYPNSFVGVLVREYTEAIYINNPFVDQIIVYDKTSDNKTKSFLDLRKEIKSFSFTHAFMLLPQERLNYLLFLSGIPNRIGVGHKLYQFLTFTKYVDRRKYIPLRHEADYCLDMLRKIGISPKFVSPEIHLSDTEKKKAQTIKQTLKKTKKYLVGINSTSGNSAPNMPVYEYLQLMRMLKTASDFSVAVMDYKVPEKLDNIPSVYYPNKSKPLRESIINFSAIDLLISSSTGPMHICAALNVPTLSLFCPLPACSPQLWGPLGNKSSVILPETGYCENVCPGDPKICKFESDGGINSGIVMERLNLFIKTL